MANGTIMPGKVIDITADQLGVQSIYLALVNNSYKANLSEAEISKITRKLEKRVNR
jgi:hypothetical protein